MPARVGAGDAGACSPTQHRTAGCFRNPECGSDESILLFRLVCLGARNKRKGANTNWGLVWSYGNILYRNYIGSIYPYPLLTLSMHIFKQILRTCCWHSSRPLLCRWPKTEHRSCSRMRAKCGASDCSNSSNSSYSSSSSSSSSYSSSSSSGDRNVSHTRNNSN